MKVVRKFDFSLSFDAPRPRPEPAAAEAEAPAQPEPIVAPEPEPPEPNYSLADLEAERQRGFAEGYAAGEAEALGRIERELAAAAARLAEALSGAADAHTHAMARVECRAAEVTLSIVRKLFPALTALSGMTEIEALVADAFEHALEEPRLIVRCAPDLKEALEPAARHAAAQAGFEGKLGIIGDQRLAGSDCRIEWTEGGIERAPRRLLEEIEATVERGLNDFARRLGLAGSETSGAIEETA